MKKKLINIAIPEALYKELQVLRDKSGVPITVMMQRAVKAYLTAHEDAAPEA